MQLLTTEEAADKLRCRPSWLREQARLRRIPFAMVAGSYRFTDTHLEQIVVTSEHQPQQVKAMAPRRTAQPPPSGETALQARRPRRSRAPDPPDSDDGTGPGRQSQRRSRRLPATTNDNKPTEATGAR